MSKRVFYQGIHGDEWIDLPASIAAAVERSPRYPYPQTPSERAAATRVKAFANPRAKGYGDVDSPWPFDRARAYNDARYRTGIRNAINSDWTASNWKHYAKQLLIEVVQDLLAAEQAVTEGILEDAQRSRQNLQKRYRTKSTSESYVRRSQARYRNQPPCFYCGNWPCICDL